MAAAREPIIMRDLCHVTRFALHTLVGVGLFLVIGLAVLLPHVFTGLIKYSGVSKPGVHTFRSLEALLFASDVVCMVLFIGRETFLFIREIIRPRPGGNHGLTI